MITFINVYTLDNEKHNFWINFTFFIICGLKVGLGKGFLTVELSLGLDIDENLAAV